MRKAPPPAAGDGLPLALDGDGGARASAGSADAVGDLRRDRGDRGDRDRHDDRDRDRDNRAEDRESGYDRDEPKEQDREPQEGA